MNTSYQKTYCTSAATNDDALKVNNHWYNKNTNPESVFKASSVGKISEKDVLVPETLKLKVGVKVLVCATT